MPFTTRATPSRRSALRAIGLLAGAAVAGAVGGCGFKLRQAPKLAFSRVLATSGLATPVAAELRRALESSGVLVINAPNPQTPADVVFDVLGDQRERVVVGLTAAGQVRELQLRTRFRFRLRTVTGADLIADTELLQTRDISFTETAVLGKEAEEALMFNDMQTDIVQQVLRQLAVVRL